MKDTQIWGRREESYKTEKTETKQMKREETIVSFRVRKKATQIQETG
jgi:hypothetical protein